MRAWLIGSALGILTWTAPVAWSQQRPAADARLAAAASVVDAIRPGNLLTSPAHTYLKQVVIYPLQQANPGRNQEIHEIFEAKTMPALEPLWRNEQVRGAAAGLFAQGFTPAELDELRAFFSTPTGRKYAAVSMEISDAAYNRVTCLMTTQTAQGAMVAAVQEMERRGTRIPGGNR